MTLTHISGLTPCCVVALTGTVVQRPFQHLLILLLRCLYPRLCQMLLLILIYLAWQRRAEERPRGLCTVPQFCFDHLCAPAVSQLLPRPSSHGSPRALVCGYASCWRWPHQGLPGTGDLVLTLSTSSCHTLCSQDPLCSSALFRTPKSFYLYNVPIFISLHLKLSLIIIKHF